MFDVIGIGALNVDYIAGSSSIRELDRDFTEESGTRFDLNVENLTSEDTVRETIARLGHNVVQPSLGGSAFMTIFTLAQMHLGLRLGYVGVAGREPDPRLSVTTTLDDLGVDRKFVAIDKTRDTGLCVSFAHEGERTLLTAPQVNATMGVHLRAWGGEVVDYLAQAKVVHVSSFLDSETPRDLADVLESLKRERPDVVVTFDPGHVWAVGSSPDVGRLLNLCDYVIVNYREFKALAGHPWGASDVEIARRVFVRCSNSCVVVVVKRYDRLQVYRRRGEHIETEEFHHKALENVEVEDATGAGDVFAAGLLASISSTKLHLELGALLGMRLARHKLRFVGSHGHQHFAQLAGGFLRTLEEETAHESFPNGVFLSHGGRSNDWRTVRDKLRAWHVPVHHFTSEERVGTAVVEGLNEYLDLCGFAVCILTGEDIAADGAMLARQNVIHEAGLFQGRLGFGRVAILVEEQCTVLSNLRGLVYIPFPQGQVENALLPLHGVLSEKGLLRTTGALVGVN